MDQEGALVRIWKTGTRRAIAYVEGRERAERVIAVARQGELTVGCRSNEKILPGSMAVYSDRRGRAYAWQITFDITCWGEVLTAAGGVEA